MVGNCGLELLPPDGSERELKIIERSQNFL
jgi:hypothetical protein